MTLKTFDWDKTIDIWEKWWNKELGRPIFKIVTPSDMKSAQAAEPVHPCLAMYDFSIPAEEIIKKKIRQQDQISISDELSFQESG